MALVVNIYVVQESDTEDWEPYFVAKETEIPVEPMSKGLASPEGISQSSSSRNCNLQFSIVNQNIKSAFALHELLSSIFDGSQISQISCKGVKPIRCYARALALHLLDSFGLVSGSNIDFSAFEGHLVGCVIPDTI